MKKLIILTIVIFFFFIGCNTSKKLLEQGDYHGAVINAVSKLKHNKDNQKQIQILQQAYPLAVKKDFDKITKLNQEGQPDRWDQIYKIYRRLKERQELVESIMPLYLDGKEVKFEHQDYTTPMLNAKRKAAEYYYANAKKLMQQHNKFAYREAFYQLQKVKQYNPYYTDIDSLMDICYQYGNTYVILIVKNSTIYKLSPGFFANLVNFPVAQLNSQWIKYYTSDERNGHYDISIYINLKIIDVSPDRLEQSKKLYKKKVKDGYEYKLDANGNIMRDSSGNPIKVPKYKTLTCTLNTFRQFKIAHIEGTIDYYNNSTRQMILQLPIAADHIYEHYYYTANGELSILPSNVRDKLQIRPEPYPHPLDMIYAANETIRSVIFDALMQNRGFLEHNF